MESALQLQNVSSQYYNQLNTIHVDVSAKLKTLGQMRAPARVGDANAATVSVVCARIWPIRFKGA
jgi:hypothetical protein